MNLVIFKEQLVRSKIFKLIFQNWAETVNSFMLKLKLVFFKDQIIPSGKLFHRNAKIIEKKNFILHYIKRILYTLKIYIHLTTIYCMYKN